MKKMLYAAAMTICLAGAALGAVQITAEEAFRTASLPNDERIVGVWRMYPITGGHSKIAHMAIVPNTTGKRQNWGYLGIMLEDGFQIKKGGVKIALRQTRFPDTFDVILSNRANESGAVYVDGGGPAFLKGVILDMNRVEVPHADTIFDDDTYRYAPIPHMVKVRDYQMKTGDPEFSLSGISFDGFKVETLTPGSIAEKAGLMPGDEIAEINGRPADEKALEQIEERLAAGRSVAIIYERGEKKSVATLKWPR